MAPRTTPRNFWEFPMPYRPDYLRLSKFYRYIYRVFDFSSTVNAMTDSRKNPTVPIAVIFRAMFLCILLRFGSKRSITKESKRHQVGKFLRADVSFCDNTVWSWLGTYWSSFLRTGINTSAQAVKTEQSLP